jgi:uncharacterized protein
MHDNEKLVRRGYDAFNRGDLATLEELIREDATFYQPGSNVVSGLHEGRDAVFGYFGRMAEASGGTFRAEIVRLFASDRSVVAIHRASGSREGGALDTETALVFRIDGGRVTSMEAVQADQAAFDAFFTPAGAAV